MTDRPDDPDSIQKPQLRLVSSQPSTGREQNEREQKIRFARADAENRLVLLAANILRVVRGAGRAYEIPRQIFDCAIAMDAYREAAGYGLSDYELSEMLSVRKDPFGGCQGAGDFEWAAGMEQMLRGSLQLAASRMLEQRTQETAGEYEMIEGVNSIGRAREEYKMERQLERPSFSRRQERPKAKAPVSAKSAPKRASAETKRPRKAKLTIKSEPTPAPAPEPPSQSPPPKAPKAKEVKGHKAVLAAYKAARGIE